MPQESTRRVHQLYGEHARRTPDAVAVVSGEQRLTYRELDERANRLARHLREAGLPPGGLVAVCLGRDAEVLTAMLGVLKAGGAYVPVEPDAPPSVLRHILADAELFGALTRESLRVMVSDTVRAGRPVICLDTQAEAIADRSAAPLAHTRAGAADLACVLYTSGTAGRMPRGVLLEHRNLVRAYEGWRVVYRLSPEDRHLQTTPSEFAGFTADWVRALCSGGTLVLAGRDEDPDRAGDAAPLHRLIVDESVTVVVCDVPTVRGLHRHLRSRGADLAAVRLIAVSGDSWYLDEQQALRRTLGPHVRILNVYGVTEAAGSGTWFELPDRPAVTEHPERVSPIGTAFPGAAVAVLGRDGAPTARGARGELGIRGPVVGRGYRDGPTFKRDQYLRTGDLGRVREDGGLEHLGRVSSHADAEAVLRGHPAVEECLVAAVENAQGHKTLTAYVTPVEGGEVDPGELRLFLSTRLPSARGPRTVVPVSSLPRTRAGKLDRTGVPLPAQRAGDRRRTSGKGALPADHGEGEGCGTWGSMMALTVFFSLLSWSLTDSFWPYSTDLSLVPHPWAALFTGLYVAESLAFGLGMGFLFCGRPLMARQGHSPGLTSAAHLAVAWLLIAWWPQDNYYRLAAKTDWSRQAALVYTFNVSLMIAAAVVVAFVATRPRHADRDADRDASRDADRS
ncbi:AMP-binding protein [Streptomyces sparsogenes]|uniref:Amino acid adenylation domain-containing protein n=1 Tax=Streptomyces sparsogenes DSM 40356 TaxID=1331668 RepID=A0A1R1SCK7_9ACTN|nr:AMP-binding protein [Streptomyces sparsogenes]OMI36000.1 amino acid adenylation domain-containing protein [Streptomyces sparsogenes DSM 40356]